MGPWYCLLCIGSVALISSSTLCFVALTTFPHCQHISFLLLLFLFRLHFNEPDRIIHFSFMLSPAAHDPVSIREKKEKKTPKKWKFFPQLSSHTPTTSMQHKSQSGNALCGFVLPSLSLCLFRCYSFSATLINESIRDWPFYDPLCDPVPEPLASNR